MKLMLFIKQQINYFYLGWVFLMGILYFSHGFERGLLIVGTLVGIVSGSVIMVVPFILTRIAKLTSPLNHILYGSFFLGALICLISNMIPPTPEQFFLDKIITPIPLSVHKIYFQRNLTKHRHLYLVRFDADPKDIHKIVNKKSLVPLLDKLDQEFHAKGELWFRSYFADEIDFSYSTPDKENEYANRAYGIKAFPRDENMDWYNLKELKDPVIYVPQKEVVENLFFLKPDQEYEFINGKYSISGYEYLIYDAQTKVAYYFIERY
jgi:hypothetical protein